MLGGNADRRGRRRRRLAVTDALTPVRRRLAVEAARAAEETEATKVNFFTMARGED